MSVKKIQEMEKDLAVMKAIVPPLMTEMKKSTEAQIDLTNEIRHLVESNDQIKSDFKDIEKRTRTLESHDAVRASSDEVVSAAKKAVIGVVIAIAIAALIVIIKMPQFKG